jgi:serine/threonine protein kinase
MRDEVIGTTIAGRYRLIEILGQGGLGTVYKALDTRVSRRVALKVLRSEVVGGKELGNLIEEFKVHRLLTHPNIVRTYECFKAGDLVFIALEYVDGRSLAQILRAEKPLDINVTLGIVCQVATALDFAHRNNVVHRDVKPANILISESGRVLLSDFGLARPSGEPGLTESGTIVGTPAYMSPEQAKGKILDPRSDVFSLGVVLYQSLTGRHPFPGESAAGILKSLAESDPRPPRAFNALIDPRLQEVVLKALAKEPENRFASMHLFEEALRLFKPPLRTHLNLANIPKDSHDEAATATIALSPHEGTRAPSTGVVSLVNGSAADDSLAMLMSGRIRHESATGFGDPLPALSAGIEQAPRMARPARMRGRLWIAAVAGTVLLSAYLALETKIRIRGNAPALLIAPFVVGVTLFLIYRFLTARVRRGRGSDNPLAEVFDDHRGGLQTHAERRGDQVGEDRLSAGGTSDVSSSTEPVSQFLATSPTTETTPHVRLPLSSPQIQLTEPSALAWLLVLNGELRGRQFRLADTFTIGRSPARDLSLIVDSSVSRLHARIALENGGFCIYDLGSKTGTKVNGESVKQKELRDRDEIRIGAHALLFISAVGPADLTLEAKQRLQDFDVTWEGLVRSVRND